MTTDLLKQLLVDLQRAQEAESPLARFGLLVIAEHDFRNAVEYARLEARRQVEGEPAGRADVGPG